MSLSDFESLDALDAAAVVEVGYLLASERRSEQLTQRALVAQLSKPAHKIVNSALRDEQKFRDTLTGGRARENLEQGTVKIL